MITNIIEYYKSNGVYNIVVSGDIKTEFCGLGNDILANLNITYIDDVRSSTFYANGISNRLNCPVILIVKYEHLTNCYTGLTEALFQQLPIITIAVASIEKNIRVEYLNACLRKGYLGIFEDIGNDILDKASNSLGPSLLVVRNDSNAEIEEKAYALILNGLNSILTKDDTVFLYGAVENGENYKFRLNSISPSYKYGIVSKYFGFSLANNKRSILVLPMFLFNYDTNIFSTRYVNNNIKIIFVKESTSKVPETWFSNNFISVLYLENIDKDTLVQFADSDKPSIIVWNIDKGGI